jgi:hypothetical protein
MNLVQHVPIEALPNQKVDPPSPYLAGCGHGTRTVLWAQAITSSQASSYTFNWPFSSVSLPNLSGLFRSHSQ